jgi:hypothetical protein
MSECQNCKDVTDFDLLWAMVKCGECGRSGAYLLPKFEATRGPIEFYPVASE